MATTDTLSLETVQAYRVLCEFCSLVLCESPSDEVLDRLIAKLGIQPEECTEDGLFSLTACRCIGACGLAPVLTVNEDVYGRLVPEDVDKILAKYTA